MSSDSCRQACKHAYIDQVFGMDLSCMPVRAASNLELLKQSIADLSSELKTLRGSFPGAVAWNKDRHGAAPSPTRVIATTSWQTTVVPIAPKDPYIPSTNNHPPSNDPVNMGIAQPHTDSPYSLDKISKAVSKTISDASRRKINIIVLGLRETEKGTLKDGYMFSKLWKYELGLEIQSKMRSTKTLGKIMPGPHDRPRPLLVVLESDGVAINILGLARSLRKSTDSYVKNNIFVNNIFVN